MHIAKIHAVVQVLVRQRAPGPRDTRGEGLGRRGDAEEVHAPLCASSTVNVEQGQRNRHGREPRLGGLVQRRVGRQPVRDGRRDQERVEGRAVRSVERGIVDEALWLGGGGCQRSRIFFFFSSMLVASGCESFFLASSAFSFATSLCLPGK